MTPCAPRTCEPEGQLASTAHAPPRGCLVTPLTLKSDVGTLQGEALGLVERRYADSGLAVTRERFSSRNEDGDVVCTARDGDRIVGTLTVRFDGAGGLKADLLFQAELDAWRGAGVTLCEFGNLAVDRHSHPPRCLLAHLFHLAYLHAHRRAGCERGVIEVHPRHVAFYWRVLGARLHTTARHNPRVEAPAVLMSFDLSTVSERIARWSGCPELLAQPHGLPPLARAPATEAVMRAKSR